MLTRDDVKKIEEVSEKVSKRVSKDTTYEFWETVTAPYLDRMYEENKKEHQETRELMTEIMHDLAEYIKDHEKRITRLETAAQT